MTDVAADHRLVSPDTHLVDLEGAHPAKVLQWAVSTIDKIAIATSFQSSGLVLLHMLREIAPDMPVLFLDTGFHFAETMAFKDRVVRMWGINIVELRGEHQTPDRQAEEHGPELYAREPGLCCHINKVEPLQRALAGYDAWISGIRRDQSPLRSTTPLVEAQLLPTGDEVLKIHPLASWDRNEVAAYIDRHSIPTHPLLEFGYRSIGCAPCTRPVVRGEDERAGRWDAFTKTECGIHSFGKSANGSQTEAEQ